MNSLTFLYELINLDENTIYKQLFAISAPRSLSLHDKGITRCYNDDTAYRYELNVS